MFTTFYEEIQAIQFSGFGVLRDSYVNTDDTHWQIWHHRIGVLLQLYNDNFTKISGRFLFVYF